MKVTAAGNPQEIELREVNWKNPQSENEEVDSSEASEESQSPSESDTDSSSFEERSVAAADFQEVDPPQIDPPEEKSPSETVLQSLPLKERVELFFAHRCSEENLRASLEETFHSSEASWEKAEAAKYLALLCRRKIDFEEKLMHFERAEKHAAEARKYFEEGFKECKICEKLILDYLEFLQERREFSRALEVCNEAIEHNPQFAKLLYLRAKIHASLENWSEALADSLAFLKFQDPKKIYEKKRIHQVEMHSLAGDCCMELGRYKEACTHYQNAYQLDLEIKRRVERSKTLLKARLLESLPKDLPKDFQKKRLEGAIALAEKKPKEALKAFSDILKSEELDPPSLFKLFFARAKVYLALGELVSARADLDWLEREVLPHIPELDRPARRVDLHHYLAKICLKEEKREEARHHFLTVWEEGKKSDDFVRSYIDLLRTEQNYEEAEKVCIESEETRSKENTMFLRAQLYFDSGKEALAKELCDALLKENLSTEGRLNVLSAVAKGCRKMTPPPFGEIYYYRREAYVLDETPSCVQRYAELLEAHEELAKNSPSIPLDPPRKSDQKLLEIGEKFIEKDPEGALKVFEQISFEALHSWKAFLSRAKVHMALCNLGEAHADVDRAWHIVHPQKYFAWLRPDPKLGPNEMEVLCCRAKLSLLEGNVDGALKDLENGWKNGKPNGSFIWQYLQALLDKKDFAKALEICAEAYKSKNFGMFNYRNWNVVIHYEAGEWSEVIRACQHFLPFTCEGSEYQIAALEKRAEAYLKMSKYSDAKREALEASEKETDCSRSLHWAEKCREIARARIVEEHLEELIKKDASENKELSASQKIAYLKEIREAYREELSESCKVSISWRLGYYLVKEDHLKEALEEYEIALKIAKKMPTTGFKIGEMEDMIKVVKKKLS